jgi:hypothetical protein
MSKPDRIRDYDLEVAYSLTCFKCGKHRATYDGECPQDAAKVFTIAGWAAVDGMVLCPPCKDKAPDRKEG